MAKLQIVLDEFAYRQFDDPNYSGTRIRMNKTEFERKVNEYYEEAVAVPARDYPVLVDGYAPFCKHIFMPNMTDARVGALPITDANAHLLRSGYKARRPEELAVLTRWFPSDLVSAPVAKFLDIILYSREQITKENAAMGNAGPPQDAPWGIVSIKAQDEPYEVLMNPITMMRNALGVSEGGSGVPIDRAAYIKSVEYWDGHAIIA